VIARRFRLLGTLSVAGSLLFLPFAGFTTATQATLFVLIGSVASLAALWAGLRLADSARLKMPLLRAYEQRTAVPRLSRAGLAATLVGGAAFGAIAITMQAWLDLASPPSPLWARLLSTLFAALTLENVLHLFPMSLLMKLLKGRAWAAIVASGLLLGLFHLSGAGIGGSALIAAAVNAGAGIFFGWIFWAFGYEYLVFAHAIAHALTLAFT